MLVKQLTAKIGADTKEFDQAMKGTSKSLQNCRKQLNKVGKVMAVAGAAIAGAMIVIIKKTAAAGDEIHKMSLRTGVSCEALSELKYAAEISGASLSAVEKGIKKMSKTIVDATDGLTTYVRAFGRIGLVAEDLIKLSPEEQFDKIARAIASVESPTIRAAAAQDIFGRAGTQLLPLFAAGAEGLDELRQKAHELGIVFDQEAANKAAELTDAMTTLKGAFTGIGQTIALEFMPYITGMADALTDSMVDIREGSKGMVKSMVSVFKYLVQTIEGVILAFNSLKVIVFGVGEEIARYLAKVTMGVIIITGYTKKMGIMKGVHEKAKMALKDLVTIGMEYGDQMENNINSMADTIELFDKILAGLDGVESGYKKAAKKAKTFGKEIKENIETIVETATPAWKKYSGLVYNIQEEVKGHIFNANEEIEGSIEIVTEEINRYWDNLTSDLGRSFGNLVNSILTKGSDLGDALSGLWTNIGNSFKALVSDFIADEMKKVFLGIIKGAVESGESILSNIGSAIKGVAKGATAAVSGLNLVGAAVTGVIAGLVSGLITGGGPSMKYTNTLLEEINWIQLNAINLKLDSVNYHLGETIPGLWNYTNSMLDVIKNVIEDIHITIKIISKKLGKITGFQTGGYVPRTQLAVVHAGETITPPAGRSGGAMLGGQPIINNITLNITAMDAIGVREFMRNRGLPEIVEAVKVNYKQSKSNMKRSLGI